MATKKFILQGFTLNTHLDAVKRLFDVPDIERVILSVAFINERGVDLIAPQLEAVADKVTVYAGIRNDITSLQSLDRLLKLGVTLYTVDTGARHLLFHPKLYFSRGAGQSRLIIGSANLTVSGLNNNIEAGVAIDLDLGVSDDKDFADTVEGQLSDLPGSYPLNVLKATSSDQLRGYKDGGLLRDEDVAVPPHPTGIAQPSGSDTVPRIQLKVSKLPSKRPTGNMTVSAPKKPMATKAGVSNPIAPEFDVVWESKGLTERDLNIPKGVNTHVTGSINLDKGLLDAPVDHRHYFRDKVFGGLNWSVKSSTVDEAYATFQLVIKGVSYGEFELRVAHSTSTTSTSYLQNNAMTRLSWGAGREHVARADLIGRTLILHREATRPNYFLIEID
jgi:hypothetical protein